jgi:hypothetical protein
MKSDQYKYVLKPFQRDLERLSGETEVKNSSNADKAEVLPARIKLADPEYLSLRAVRLLYEGARIFELPCYTSSFVS